MSTGVNVKYERPDSTQVHQSGVRDVAVSQSFIQSKLLVNHDPYFIRIKDQRSRRRGLMDFHTNVSLISCRSVWVWLPLIKSSFSISTSTFLMANSSKLHISVEMKARWKQMIINVWFSIGCKSHLKKNNNRKHPTARPFPFKYTDLFYVFRWWLVRVRSVCTASKTMSTMFSGGAGDVVLPWFNNGRRMKLLLFPKCSFVIYFEG